MVIRSKIDICLVVDTSGSLMGECNTINNSLNKMIDNIKNNNKFHGCDVYLTLVAFNDKFYKVVDFELISKVKFDTLKLTFTGQTNPGPALEYVVDSVMNRYLRWKNDGNGPFHPLIFFFTDGTPYPEHEYLNKYKEVANKVRELESNGKLRIVCAGYGNVNMNNLRLLTKSDNFVVKMSGRNPDYLRYFFETIITVTAVSALTDSNQQMVRAFRLFNMDDKG